MASHISQSLHDEVHNAWQSAVDSFESLKNDGKINQAQWDKLQSTNNARDLLQDIQSAPYATTQDSKRLLRLAERSVNGILRFDNEIENIASGISTTSFGIPSTIWGALRIVLHVSQDIFKSPEVLVEIVTKIFVFMPRIDLYFELFHDKDDILEIKSLLVSLYKLIIDFNIKSMTWYSSSKGSKFRRAFREDPRAQFQEILGRMSEKSEEMRKNVEAINIKSQVQRHKEMLEEFQRLETTHQQYIEEVRDIITKQNEGTMEKVMTALLADAREQQKQEELMKAEKAARSKREREKRLEPYNKLSQIRESFWHILHKSPWTVIIESSITDSEDPRQDSHSASWHAWDKGRYTTDYPVDDSLSDITLLVDWKAMTDAEKPSLRWIISVPTALYYPGQHFGRLELKKSFGILQNPGFDVTDSRLRIKWESPIFSPLPSVDAGYLSSIGPLEEKCVPLILTSALQSIAHHLIHGPYPCSDASPLPWHPMNAQVDKYLNRKIDSNKEQGMRATALFANAFTKTVEGLDNFDQIPLQPDCKEASVMAVRELTDFCKIQKRMTAGEDFREGYDSLYTQRDLVHEDRKWALYIAEAAGLSHLAATAKQSTTADQISQDFEVMEHTQIQKASLALAPATKLSKEAPSASEPREIRDSLPHRNNTGPLGDDGLPHDWSPLHRAVWNQNLNTVVALADRFTVKSMDDCGYTPLHLACTSSESSLFTFRQIFPRGLKQRLITPYGERHLCLPFRRENESSALQIVTMLVEAGAIVNAEASRGRLSSGPWTPMHCVASSGWTEVAQYLLEAGGKAFSPNICSPWCWAHDQYPSLPERPTMKSLLGSHISENQMKDIFALHERHSS